MFTGIIKAQAVFEVLKQQRALLTYALCVPPEIWEGLEVGASVAIDGICQTLVKLEPPLIWFQAIEETLQCTTLKDKHVGSLANIERSLKIGEEVGGHLLSGHVSATAQLIGKRDNIYLFSLAPAFMKYLFPKGFIAVDGVSLTLGQVDHQMGCFAVHLIPETLKRTTLGEKKRGDWVNIEIDAYTRAAVDTMEQLFHARFR